MKTAQHEAPKMTATNSGGRSFFAPVVQTKLTVNTPGDQYEQEADRAADQVMRMQEGDAPIAQRMPLSPFVQRKCAEIGRAHV